MITLPHLLRVMVREGPLPKGGFLLYDPSRIIIPADLKHKIPTVVGILYKTN